MRRIIILLVVLNLVAPSLIPLSGAYNLTQAQDIIGTPTYTDSQGNVQFGEKPKPWVDKEGEVHFEQRILPDDSKLQAPNNLNENYHPRGSRANPYEYADKAIREFQASASEVDPNAMMQPLGINKPSIQNNSTPDKVIVRSSLEGKMIISVILAVLGLIGVVFAVKHWLTSGAKLEEKSVKNDRLTKSEALAILKEKKELLDLGVISSEDYEKAKGTLTPYLLNVN